MKFKENIFNKIILKILNLKKEMSTKVQEEYRTPNREDQKKYFMPYNSQNIKCTKPKKRY